MSESPVPAHELGVVRPFERIEWVDEIKFGRVSADVSDVAKQAGAGRKFMSRGVVPANHEYGLRSGPDGMEFLTIRGGDAQVTFDASATSAEK